MADDKQIDFVDGVTPVIADWLDRMQEVLQALLLNANLTISGTTITLVAGTLENTVSAVLKGKLRYVTSNLSINFTGFGAGTYGIWLTTTSTDSAPSFAMVANTGTPGGVTYLRKIANVVWSGTAFSAQSPILLSPYTKHAQMHLPGASDPLPNAIITTSLIGDFQVTTAKLADGSVTSLKIADLTIATADIVDGAVTAAKLGTDAVTTTKIATGAVTADEIGTGAVTEDKIPNLVWTALGLTGNYSNLGNVADVNGVSGNWQTAEYSRNAEGVVQLRGVVKTTTSIGASPFTLPAGYRPAMDEVFWLPDHNNSINRRVYIPPTGVVQIPAGFSGMQISLSGITFSVA